MNSKGKVIIIPSLKRRSCQIQTLTNFRKKQSQFSSPHQSTTFSSWRSSSTWWSFCSSECLSTPHRLILTRSSSSKTWSRNRRPPSSTSAACTVVSSERRDNWNKSKSWKLSSYSENEVSIGLIATSRTSRALDSWPARTCSSSAAPSYSSSCPTLCTRSSASPCSTSCAPSSSSSCSRKLSDANSRLLRLIMSELGNP